MRFGDHTPCEPDDELDGLWSREQLLEMNARFADQLERAFACGTDTVIQLSEVRMSRPWTRARVLANVLVTRHPNPNVNTFAHENPILPRAISEASCTIMLDGAIGRQGKPMTAVFKVSDQFGRWHKVKFRLIDPRGEPRR
jgi:hypothetical protein